ncbi:hypothetical protein IMG5_075770 [Ichthyophthirius multifiliis]|uniref:Ferric reductase NAD binding domain-containing protein n=1 Tax=Ichthyophthirius multifiliis TaxID=5932 RepID=G0QQ61_ICHMU|nr:hypothetical protein IMG5_075770 [Ichthyophthirius multifiliis]EGR32640.1 hypothetical protein IMG5_075770 [Ichthyophthirius multifiliis]|eukprot:XP_004036626.1 hypothetical protein IMG5_075770 [Ichthyophthirius multifiliis]
MAFTALTIYQAINGKSSSTTNNTNTTNITNQRRQKSEDGATKTTGANASIMMTGEQGKPNKEKGFLDGPYGSHSINIHGHKYQHFVCVSGGIGVTPILSTAKEILHEIKKGRIVKSLYFIWSGRDVSIIQNLLKPNELETKETELVKSFYHLTTDNKNAINKNDIEMQNMSNTLLTKLVSGRPNLNKYFENIYNSVSRSDTKHIGVFVCGPSAIINKVEILAQKWSKDQVIYDVHQEVFEF